MHCGRLSVRVASMLLATLTLCSACTSLDTSDSATQEVRAEAPTTTTAQQAATSVDPVLEVDVSAVPASDDLVAADTDQSASAEGDPEDSTDPTAPETGEAQPEGDDADAGAANGATSTSTTARVPTTSSPTTATTAASTTTARPRSDGRFRTLPPGSSLPSGDWCAANVRPADETRSMNSRYNATRGSGPHDELPRVDGNFTGTTDEILQWVACKWGIDEDIVRAQAAIESWWDAANEGDMTSRQTDCHPDLRRDGPCPKSIGILQIKYPFHTEAYEDSNAIRSTAYNADYVYGVWRECYEGRIDWLNDVERGREYRGGDVEGCLGFWFAGRWYARGAEDYIAELNDFKRRRVWETYEFLQYKG